MTDTRGEREGRPASLARQVRFGLVAVVTLVLTAASATLIVIGAREQLDQLATLQQERGRRAAVEIDGYLDDLLRKLGYLSRVRGLTLLPAEAQHDLLDALLRHNSAYEEVALLDSSGRVVTGASAYGPLKLEGGAGSPAFRAAFGEGEDFVGVVEMEPALKRPQLTLAVPARDRFDRIAGVLVARVNLEFLSFVVSEVGVGRTGYAYVVDNRGVLIAEKGKAAETFALEDLSARPFMRRLMAGKGVGTSAYRGLEGTKVLGAAAPATSARWNVVVELPTSEAYAPIRRMVLGMGAALGIAELLALELAFLFSRRIVVPLRALTRAAADIRAGDLDARVAIVSRNELGLLASTFNEMAGELRSLVQREAEHLAEQARLVAAAQVARAEVLAERRAAAFLAEASTLFAESLDYAAILKRVPRLVLPYLADWCVIDIVGDDAKIHRVSGAHMNPAKETLVSELRERYVPDWRSPQPAVHVLRTGAPLIMTTEESVRDHVRNGEHARLLEEIGTRSAMSVPLIVRGRTLGAITVGSMTSGRYGPGDLPLVEELARRAAMALDNARLYDEERAAVRARELFLSIASHELRAPLTPLMVQVELLLRTAKEGALARVAPERVVAQLESVDRQTRRLARLLDQLLDLSRMSMGRLSLELEELDLADLVRQVVGRHEVELARAGYTLAIAAPGPVMGRWDRSRLEQVVTNLLGNAIKYGQGKPIEIAIDARDTTARLAVRDHGIGISLADQQRIFQRFERAVSHRDFIGLGLGLHIARQIIEAHGGTIRVESQVGAGSTFTVELPRRGPEARPAPGAGRPGEGSEAA